MIMSKSFYDEICNKNSTGELIYVLQYIAVKPRPFCKDEIKIFVCKKNLVYKEEIDALQKAKKFIIETICELFKLTEADAIEKAKEYDTALCEITDGTDTIYISVQEQEIL